MSDINQHNREIRENQSFWQGKPLLRRVYRDFYTLISRNLSGNEDGSIVEIGSGTGNIIDVIPDCIRTDLFPNPWIDLVENVYSLSIRDRTVSDLILFDVFHHLRFPGAAFREFHRVLTDKGRLIILDPCIGWLGYIVYNYFHREPLGLEENIRLTPPVDWTPDQADYYAAQAQATRIFLRGEREELLSGWKLTTLKRMSAISYVASGGYSGPQLYPASLYPLFRLIDRGCDLFPRLFATRMLVVLEKA